MVRFSFLLMMALLVGCESAPSKQVAGDIQPDKVEKAVVVSPVEPVRSEFSQIERDRILLILELLDSADQAIKDRRLAQPRGNSAVDYYRQVLKIQPGYHEAQSGLENIVDRYIEWSDAAVRQGRLQQAHHYLAQARQIDPDAAEIEQAALRLKRLGKSQGGYTRLDRRQVKIKSPDLVQVLGRLADRIRAEDARVVIDAPTDSQGRWIYHQLNQRHEDYRVRANMRIESQPGVRLMY
ncbi:MAG: hypothetical protein V7752_10480 [Halopseudomonas sp.]